MLSHTRQKCGQQKANLLTVKKYKNMKESIKSSYRSSSLLKGPGYSTFENLPKMLIGKMQMRCFCLSFMVIFSIKYLHNKNLTFYSIFSLPRHFTYMYEYVIIFDVSAYYKSGVKGA